MPGLTSRLDDLGTARKLRQRNLERARRAVPEFRRGLTKAAAVCEQETRARAHPSFRQHIRARVTGGGAFLQAAVGGDLTAKPHMLFQDRGTGLHGPKARAYPIRVRFKRLLRWFEGGGRCSLGSSCIRACGRSASSLAVSRRHCRRCGPSWADTWGT